MPAQKSAQPPAPSAEMKALLEANQKRLANHLTKLVPALMKAPIYLVSTHGQYDLRQEPVLWTVPPNTWIFETQSIGDTTLTAIDNLLWKLCMTKYRPAFFNYFMGNRAFFEKQGKKPLQTFIELFRNLTLYKPGDSIYERKLTIGGGHGKEPDGSARSSYVNMGFYKFSVEPPTPDQRSPKMGTKRPMVPTEIAELDNFRTELISDEDFSFTNKQFVDLINRQRPIRYAGIPDISEPKVFNYENDGETVRIFIFSSCAVANCNPPKPHKPWPPVDLPSAEAAKLVKAYAASVKAAYNSDLCNDRIDKIDRLQNSMNLEMSEMGIHTGPGGSGWDLDLDNMNELAIRSMNMRAKGKMAPQSFLPGARAELFAEIDEDMADWWKRVEEAPGNFDSSEERNAMGGTRRKNKHRRRTASRRFGVAKPVSKFS